jgi:DUF4097 and DUF4098 domain-containing protein YvlB
VLTALGLGCNVSLNKDVTIEDGRRSDLGCNSINGSIRIGDDCVLNGEYRSINGSIEVGRGSSVRKLQSVNGGIRVLDGGTIERGIDAVNGSVELGMGASVTRGSIKTVNGSVELDSASVRDDIVTFNGNIRLDRQSVVQGDIRIKHGKNRQDHDTEPLTVEVANGSVVYGDIIAHREGRKVQVLLSNGGQVKGKVVGATIVQK